jgi:hypothetical protein
MCSTEHAHPTAQPTDEWMQTRIIGVEDGDIIRSLIGKDLHLRCQIGRHGAVTIEVIGED